MEASGRDGVGGATGLGFGRGLQIKKTGIVVELSMVVNEAGFGISRVLA